MRQDNDVIDSTGPLDKNETKLFGWSNGVRSMTKTRQDNKLTHHIGAVYTEIGTKH